MILKDMSIMSTDILICVLGLHGIPQVSNTLSVSASSRYSKCVYSSVKLSIFYFKLLKLLSVIVIKLSTPIVLSKWYLLAWSISKSLGRNVLFTDSSFISAVLE